MRFEVEVQGCVVTCNIDSLRADSKYLYGDYIVEGEEDDYTDSLGGGYRMTKQDYEEAKKSFYEAIDSLSPDFIKSKLEGRLQFTKKGNLDKRRSHLLIESGIISGYSNEYGSHNYKVPSIMVTPNGDKSMTVYYTSRSQQDPF